MAEVLVAEDVESALVVALGTPTGIPWSTKVPNPRPAEFGRVKRLGGTRSKMILDSPMVGFWCWADTTVRASELGRLTEGLVFALEGTFLGAGFVYRVQPIAGVQTTEDPDSKTPLALFTVQITWRLTRQ